MSSPQLQKTDVVTFILSVGGTDVTGKYEVFSIHINKEVNRIPSARIVLSDGDTPTQNFPVSAAETFALGTAIVIEAGYHSTNQQIFSGIIVRQEISAASGQNSTLTLECRDKAVKMTIARKSAYFTQKTDAQIISSIFQTYGLTGASSSEGGTTPATVVQNYCTDWDFVNLRAQVNGLVIAVSDGTVSCAAPDLSTDSGVTLTYGVDIYELEMLSDVRSQFPSVQSTSWDATTQAILSETASPTNLNTLGADTSSTLGGVLGLSNFPLTTAAPVPDADLQTWAKAAMLKAELAKINGRIRCQGVASAKLGTTVSLSGMGTRFNGTGYISGISHTIEEGTWRTDLALGLSQEWFSSEPGIAADPTSGQLTPARGLYHGIVKQIDSDPTNEFRVRILIPVISMDGDGVWARLATLHATNTAGTYFYPEVDDEVIVGFANEDPRFPIILGSLYSSQKHASPYTPDANNYTKAIITPKQLKVIFDDEKKSITLSTPGGNTAVLSDDTKSISLTTNAGNKFVLDDQGSSITLTDQNGNKVTMSSSGIDLNSIQDINLTAAAAVTIKANGGKLTGNGVAGVDLSGSTVSISADTTLTAKGLTYEISASGPGSIKAAILQIN